MNLDEFLQTVPALEGLSRSDVDALRKIMVTKDYPDGHEFAREATAGQDIFLIMEGEVAVTHQRGKQRGFLDIKHMYEGEFLGLLSLIDDGKHEASCKAVGPVKAASMPRSAFKLLYDANVPLAFHFQQLVGQQIMRDYRTLVHLLRAVLFAEDEDQAERAVHSIVSKYRGPERRTSERRGLRGSETDPEGGPVHT